MPLRLNYVFLTHTTVHRAPSSSSQVYTEAVLGSAPELYAQNILQPKAWGGAIELSLFAHHYGVEMVAIDIKTGTAYRYGEDQRFPTRAFFMYSGIHYDAVAMTPFQGAPEALDQATFAATDDWAFGCALGLATELRKVRWREPFVVLVAVWHLFDFIAV
jgi:ubiquitin thioesterase OTU1